ncbi:MAG: hypothetical protein M0041_04725 [Nitrospiraceae bacterium]|nr:hypothetical protein [Nitrospiraceae bacterium]
MKKKERLPNLSLQELRKQIVLLTAEQKILAHDTFFAELSQFTGVKIHSQKTTQKLIHWLWESHSENGPPAQLKKLREQLVSLEKNAPLPDPSALLSEEEAAQYLGFSSKNALLTLRKSGLGPPSRRLNGGNQVVYSLSGMNFFLLHGTANPSPPSPQPVSLPSVPDEFSERLAPEFHALQKDFLAFLSAYQTNKTFLFRWGATENRRYWRTEVYPEELIKNWLLENHSDKAYGSVVRFLLETAFLRLSPLPSPKPGIVPTPGTYLLLEKKKEGIHTTAITSDNDKDLMAYGIRFCSPITYDRSAKAETFREFLDLILPVKELQALLQEFVGYTLLSNSDFHVCQVWTGNRASGVTHLANIIRKLHEFVHTVPLSAPLRSKPELLLKSSLVIVDDLSVSADEENLRHLIAGRPVDLRFSKGSYWFYTPVTAKWLLTGQELFPIKDRSDELWKQLSIVPFQETVDLNRANTYEQTVTKKELRGVLNWALEGAQRLLKHGHFTRSKASAKALLDARHVDNSVYWYVQENNPEKNDYLLYKSWAETNGFVPENRIRFERLMKEFSLENKEERT